MVKNRNQLPKTVVESPLLEMLKASLVKALGSLMLALLSAEDWMRYSFQRTLPS